VKRQPACTLAATAGRYCTRRSSLLPAASRSLCRCRWRAAVCGGSGAPPAVPGCADPWGPQGGQWAGPV
jgi:hypothetical protein